jgi:hypothetical protein
MADQPKAYNKERVRRMRQYASRRSLAGAAHYPAHADPESLSFSPAASKPVKAADEKLLNELEFVAKNCFPRCVTHVTEHLLPMCPVQTPGRGLG